MHKSRAYCFECSATMISYTCLRWAGDVPSWVRRGKRDRRQPACEPKLALHRERGGMERWGGVRE